MSSGDSNREKSPLKVISERSLQHAVDPSLIAYCPSMKLLALASTDHEVWVYRLNGQRVFGGMQKKAGLSHVVKIAWKPNGQLLATAWNDGFVRLLDAESNKTVHQIPMAAQKKVEITCIAWGVNLKKINLSRSWSQRPGLSWKDLVEEKIETVKHGPPLDLPRDLTLIDFESSMPKLSVLPAAGTSEDIFSSRASLDGLFRGFDPEDNNSVDVLVVGTSDGFIHLSIYDSFVIGSFPPPSQTPKSHLVCHASHKLYSTHALLLKPVSSLVSGLYLIPMDLRFVSASSGYLSLLASRSTELENLLRYMNQVRILMVTEWQAVQELPGKFLRNINETLISENSGDDIVKSMYHSVVTGHTHHAVKEWLVDELAERGHKRWDKAVAMGLENLRKLVHEDMLPVLERCTVILSRLLGIARYQGSNDSVGFSSTQISLLMDTVLCLNLITSRLLTYVVDEIDLFAAFSTWLRYEIDRLASDTPSSPSDDIDEKESAIDHSKVLRYIQTMMTTSRLGAFFENGTEDDQKSEEVLQSSLQISDKVNAQLRLHEIRKPYFKSFLSIEILCKRLGRQSNAVFEHIAQAEKRNVRFGDAVFLTSDQRISQVSMRICPRDETHFSANIAVISEKQENSVLSIYSIGIRIEKGISTVVSRQDFSISFVSSALKDIAFLSDEALLVLQDQIGGQPRDILAIPYRAILNEVDVSEQLDARQGAQLSLDDILAQCIAFEFPKDASFIPRKMEIARDDDAVEKEASLCVLGEDTLKYKMFGLTVEKGDAVASEDAKMG